MQWFTSLSANWVDGVISIILGYYLLHGWQTGLVYLGVNLLSFLTSLYLSLRYHTLAGNFVSEKFGVPASWTGVLGYIIVGFGSEFVMREILHTAVKYIPKKFSSSYINQWLGACVSLINGFVLVTFFLLVILALPMRGTIRPDIRDSLLGGTLVSWAERYAKPLSSAVGSVTKAAAKQFVTIQPKSTDSIPLDIRVDPVALKPDMQAEQDMLALVNAERKKIGVGTLVLDTTIVAVSRLHSRDMLERMYFSHVSPEGMDGAQRMNEGGVTFKVAGENLAYAPDTQTAHEGLMNSEGHKRNILDPQFRRIGIGVIDAGSYGKMYTQNFAD